MNDKFSELVRNASRITIISHTTPDYDAYASLLYMYAAIRTNFPDTQVRMCLDTDAVNPALTFLPYIQEIKVEPLLNNLNEHTPDLIVLVDAPSVLRVSRKTEFETITQKLENTTKVIFDHHQIEDTDAALLVNENCDATVDVIHNYLVTNNWKLPERWEEYYLTGFIGDTYRFYYTSPFYKRVFDTMTTILDHGYTIRDFSDKLYGYTEKDLLIYRLLLTHMRNKGNYLLSYITWDEYEKEIKPTISEFEYKKGRRFFIDEFMNKAHGFDFAVSIVPDDTVKDGRTYSGSIRAKEGTIDCTVVAKALNGGGHVGGSGFEIKADSIEEAITQFENALLRTEIEARNALKK